MTSGHRSFNPTLSWDRCLARVEERHVEARDTVSLVLKPNRRFHGFQPGQHLNVTVEVNGARLTRSYSPSDSVRKDGRVRLTIKAIPGGKVSQHLVHRCQSRRCGRTRSGLWRYGACHPRRHAWLFVAAGSGITPIMSLLQHPYPHPP
jgi:stearoyl-CoA 9-desaturase NADPH oxidoreductase